MTRAARVTGIAVGLFTLVGAGGLSLAMLAIRSPLAGGGHASGPAPAAYAMVFAIVAGGAFGAGVIAAGIVELLIRFTRPADRPDSARPSR